VTLSFAQSYGTRGRKFKSFSFT